jgi:hypothetical protein
LTLLQRSVVEGVELVGALVLEENAAGREKGVSCLHDSDDCHDSRMRTR